jgi:hypothetical protein
VAAVVSAVALIAAPPALGAKPTRTVIGSTGDFLIPAGFGCSFDVGVQADEDARGAITEFSDGRVQIVAHAELTLRNPETGDSVVQRSSYKETDTFDTEANDLLIEISGRYGLALFPGDQGPAGEVGESGALFAVTGRQQFTLDLDSDLVTSYSLNGQATDLCPLLSAS